MDLVIVQLSELCFKCFLGGLWTKRVRAWLSLLLMITGVIYS